MIRFLSAFVLSCALLIGRAHAQTTELFYTQTSGVNAAMDTGASNPNGIDTTPYDAIFVTVDLTPGNTNVQFNYYVYIKSANGTGVHVGQNAIPANQWHAGFSWGIGCGYTYNGMNAINAPLGRRINIAFDAPGAGVTTTLRIWGHRRAAGGK